MAYDENNFDQVGELLGTLKRVEPPGDFDVRVRARIAQGRPAASRSWPFVLARVGVPAAVLMALGGYFGWNALNQPVNVPIVVEVQQQAPSEEPPVQPQIDRPAAEPENLVATRDGIPVVNSVPAGPGVRPTDSVRPTSEPDGGSVDFGVSPSKRILPRGLDPDREIKDANIAGNSRSSAREVLGMLGILASCSASSCRVNSVSANSVAGSSGIKAGDVIEAVDGRPVNGTATFSGQFSAGNVRIRRNGSLMNVALRP